MMSHVSPPNGPAGKIVIIGVGNLLLKDEGVGVHVAQELQKKSLPSAVEVHDGGVAGIGLLDFFPGASKVLLIDAAEMNLEAGAVVRFTPEEVAGKRWRAQVFGARYRPPRSPGIGQSAGSMPAGSRHLRNPAQRDLLGNGTFPGGSGIDSQGYGSGVKRNRASSA